MQVDRYISEPSPELYVLVAYGAAFPATGVPTGGGWTGVGASDTRTYPEEVCNEIEGAIRSKGFWLGRFDFRGKDPGRASTAVR